jgi:hypothetical protein
MVQTRSKGFELKSGGFSIRTSVQPETIVTQAPQEVKALNKRSAFANLSKSPELSRTAPHREVICYWGNALSPRVLYGNDSVSQIASS